MCIKSVACFTSRELVGYQVEYFGGVVGKILVTDLAGLYRHDFKRLAVFLGRCGANLEELSLLVRVGRGLLEGDLR